MKFEFTATIETAVKGGYWAICAEIPGSNGQGETVEATKQNLAESIELILADRRDDIMRGLPEDVIKAVVTVG